MNPLNAQEGEEIETKEYLHTQHCAEENLPPQPAAENLVDDPHDGPEVEARPAGEKEVEGLLASFLITQRVEDPEGHHDEPEEKPHEVQQIGHNTQDEGREIMG